MCLVIPSYPRFLQRATAIDCYKIYNFHGIVKGMLRIEPPYYGNHFNAKKKTEVESGRLSLNLTWEELVKGQVHTGLYVYNKLAKAMDGLEYKVNDSLIFKVRCISIDLIANNIDESVYHRFTLSQVLYQSKNGHISKITTKSKIYKSFNQ